MIALYSIPIFYYMAEQTLKQNTIVMWATSTPPTKYTGSLFFFQEPPGLRQSLKLDSKCRRSPTMKSLRPLCLLAIGQFTEACFMKVLLLCYHCGVAEKSFFPIIPIHNYEELTETWCNLWLFNWEPKTTHHKFGYMSQLFQSFQVHSVEEPQEFIRPMIGSYRGRSQLGYKHIEIYRNHYPDSQLIWDLVLQRGRLWQISVCHFRNRWEEKLLMFKTSTDIMKVAVGFKYFGLLNFCP